MKLQIDQKEAQVRINLLETQIESLRQKINKDCDLLEKYCKDYLFLKEALKKEKEEK